ncbi:MAG TPA: hypothetical protein DEF61_02820, partial [Firmicutes bacterium]|nr:hypothetical protein [Bacillota bacterium]
MQFAIAFFWAKKPFFVVFIIQYYKIALMENIIEDLAYRGLIEQYSDENKIKELLNTKQTVYCGFDPSAVSMHLGNYVMISLLKRFQMHGHKVVAVVGG